MSLERFLEHARAGRHATASSGEKACQRIAKAILEMNADLDKVDVPTKEGILDAFETFVACGYFDALQAATAPLPVETLEDRDERERELRGDFQGSSGFQSKAGFQSRPGFQS